MKTFQTIIIAALAAIVFFFVGKSVQYHIDNGEITSNADGILAYQHYYECAESILSCPTEEKDSLVWVEYLSAKRDLDRFKQGHVMTWPTVCDQRDVLSDIIRCYKDNHPEQRDSDDIFQYVRDFGVNPESLKNWVYCY